MDASSWSLALVDAGSPGEAARRVLSEDPTWTTPTHTRLEVLRTLRRFEQGRIQAAGTVEVLAAEVIAAEVHEVLPDTALLTWVWQHRHHLSAYAAPYVALAVRHRAALVTNDGRLARAAEALGVEVVVPA